MLRKWIYLAAAAVVLAGCSAAEGNLGSPEASNPAVEPAATQAPAVTEEATPPSTLATETPTGAVEPSPQPTATTGSLPVTGTTAFKIVPGESTVTYEVGETFFDQNNRFNVAIGQTGAVSGTINVDLANPLNSSLGTLSVDISQFSSDSARRDNAIRDRFIQTSLYPMVTFVPTEITGLPAVYQPGEQITFQVAGDLTIRDVTRPAVFTVTGSLTEAEATGAAETTILMSDFGFGPISVVGILGTEDEVKISVEFVARP